MNANTYSGLERSRFYLLLTYFLSCNTIYRIIKVPRKGAFLLENLMYTSIFTALTLISGIYSGHITSTDHVLWENEENMANVFFGSVDGLIKERIILETHEVWVTAYSSSPDETDDTPFITASGGDVRDGVMAAYFLPF